MPRQIRMGIDVGGTHTKAVAVDGDTGQIVGKVQVLTTHDAKEGVAKGVVECFKRCMEENNIEPDEITFLAHSTTQATNALLEGDVAEVGILSSAGSIFAGILTRKQTNIGDVPLVTGRYIKTHHQYLSSKKVTEESVRDTIEKLRKEGAQVIVATEAFGVDDAPNEKLIQKKAGDMGIAATAAYEISKLYGLTVRTRTAVINASILPKMLETANSTLTSVKKAGIRSPLMIMRGDGGVMTAEEMKKRPILSMLSGPTASVIGALMYLRASVGIYFEVGGTSTNIGVIKNGRPTVKYAQLGGYRTYVNSLDVRVLGVAGGSMVRAGKSGIIDVGPRSAHIAGLGYAAFTDPKEIVDPEIEFITPKEGDPRDYVAIKCSNGKRLTITNTCAANVLGLVDDKFYAKGNAVSCRKAMEPLASYLGMSVEDTARAILKKATEKLIPVVNDLIQEYRLDEDQSILVGCGGGAAALIPFMAQEMNIKYKIPENADVISSIGVALAMVREVVERVIPNPSEEEIANIRREAVESAIRVGADPEGIETVIEIDSKTQRVRVTAMGASELKTDTMMKEVTEKEARQIAADSMGLPPKRLELEGNTEGIYVYTSEVVSKKGIGKKTRHPLRAVDRKGFIKAQYGNSRVMAARCRHAEERLVELWDATSIYRGDAVSFPDLYIVVGSHIIELAGMISKEQILAVARAELQGISLEQKILLIGVENDF